MDTTITRARRMYAEIEQEARSVFYGGANVDPDTIMLERSKETRNNRVTFDLIINDAVATESKTTDEIRNFLEGASVFKQLLVMNGTLNEEEAFAEPIDEDDGEEQGEPEAVAEEKPPAPSRERIMAAREKHKENAAIAARRGPAVQMRRSPRKSLMPQKRGNTAKSFMDRFGKS